MEDKGKLYDYLSEETKTKLKQRKPATCCVCGKEIKWPNVVLKRFIYRVCKDCDQKTSDIEVIEIMKPKKEDDD